MTKIGITGQNGFVGDHLYHTLALFKDEFELIEFDRSYWDNTESMDKFAKQCDVIVHLAAMNRHPEPNVIYQTNIHLVQQLVAALQRTESKAHIIFSSSTQEEKDNLYGKSKKEGRTLLADWATKSGGTVTGMVVPNVYGPFGKPFYNSVVATFCTQVAKGETPEIQVDGELKLIYVGELVQEIIRIIRTRNTATRYIVPHTAEAKVSEILSLLQQFKTEYQNKGVIPAISNNFELNLFNTYRCYMDIATHFPVKFTQHTDPRGAFVEVIRLGVGGQVSFSTTVPGITRGNHFHTRKIERFAVIKGHALIQLRKIGGTEVLNFELSGKEPAFVDMPIWYTHNIKNTGSEDLYTIFWINEPYNADDADTYLETV